MLFGSSKIMQFTLLENGCVPETLHKIIMYCLKTDVTHISCVSNVDLFMPTVDLQ